MKKLLLLLLVITSCSGNDSNDGCECTGKFTRANNTSNYFYVNGVDCETGEPALSQQNQGEQGQTNPAFYLGCDE